MCGGLLGAPCAFGILLRVSWRVTSASAGDDFHRCSATALHCRVRDFEVIDKAPYGVVFSWEKDGKVVESNVFDRNSSTPSVKAISVSR